jgi:hypothetical protein
MTVFLDAAPVAGGIAAIAGVAFFLVLAAVAFIAFRLLKKTVKMAFRMAIVAIILVIAAAGSISFWWLGSSKTTRPERPAPTRPK